ncbi:MAG: hypothetical protein ACREPS_10805 [Rhodanobacteraceae bacterium]
MTRWRAYEPGDEIALRAAHATQCQAAGTDFAFPNFADPRYILVSVAERNGEVIGAVAAHATIEMLFVGGDAPMVRSAVRRRGQFAAWLRTLGCDEAHAFVPNRLVKKMEPVLQRLGFRRSNSAYTTFYAEL